MRQLLLLGVAVITVSCGGSESLTPLDSSTSTETEAVQTLPSTRDEQTRAFGPSVLFQRLPTPQPGDWRRAHPEPEQTFEQFAVDASRQRVTADRRTIYLQPLGTFTEQAPPLTHLQACAAAYFMLPVQVLPPLDPSTMNFTTRINRNTGQPQILTGDVLHAMRNRLPADAYCMIAITMTDLYPHPSWNFVFGQATLSERVGVFSFARYHPGFWGLEADANTATVVLRRSCKVMTHEIGHMFGIHHCQAWSCNMCGSNNQAESDARPIHLCPVCLKKLHYAIGFNLLRREEQLRAFYTAAGLKEEAEWTLRRIAEIKGMQK